MYILYTDTRRVNETVKFKRSNVQKQKIQRGFDPPISEVSKHSFSTKTEMA